MRFYESKAIACALSLAMATSMALPIGAFAAVDDSGQTQHEQKADGVEHVVLHAQGIDYRRKAYAPPLLFRSLHSTLLPLR